MQICSRQFVRRIMLLAMVSLCAMSSAYSKQIDLFDEPTVASNVVDSLNTEAGVILIYAPKNSGWVKIANPKNGKVGWIKSNDLGGSTQTTVSMSSSGHNNEKEVNTIMHFGQPVTPEKAQAMVKQLKAQQRTAQQNMQRLVNNMNQLFQEEWRIFNNAPFPAVAPIIFVPEDDNAKGSPSSTK